MAATLGQLSTQLDDKLSDQNEPLSKRLEVAQTVFCSSAIPIVQKEEQILSWLLETISCNTDYVDRKEILYHSLLRCLQSKRMHSFNGNIKPAVISRLLQVLKFEEDNPTNIKSAIRSCCVEIFQIPFFQRWFMCDVENLCKTASYFFKSVLDEASAEDFVKVLEQFLFIHKMTLLKGELRTIFVKDVMKCMCEALANIPSEKRTVFLEKATFSWQEVLFYEGKFIEDYIGKEDSCSNEVKSFIKKIKHFPTKNNVDSVEICYSLFLKSVISKYLDEYDKIFKVFVSLCPPLGIIVNRMFSIEMNPVRNWDFDKSFLVMSSLIDILDNSKIPLTCQLDDISLQNWFTSLLIGLMNLNSHNTSISFFEMVRRVYQFNPLLIGTTIKEITQVMLQVKTPSLQPIYIELMLTIIRGSSKIQRLQKFIALFLQHMQEYMVYCKEDLTIEDVLPEKVREEFSTACAALPTVQILSMTKSFLFHLQCDCLSQVESCQDHTVSISVGVISELLNILIRSSNIIIDYSVPEVVKSKYKNLLEEMQVLLKLFGNIYQDIHEDSLLKPYLLLCRAFGTMKLLFREYENIEIVPPLDVDLEPTNLSYVHNYLHPDVWKRIAESIEEHENCEARYEFFELLIEKVQAVAQVEEGSEGPGTFAARYLLQYADVEWVWKKLLILAPLFQSAELAKLVSKIVHHFGSDQSKWIPLLKLEGLTENRRLTLATAFSLLYKASKKINSGVAEHESVSKQVLSLIVTDELLDYELSQLITDDEELKEKVEEWLQEMTNVLNENMALEHTPTENIPHLSMIEVPARLPLQHLSPISGNCALLSAIALLYDLPDGSQPDNYLFNLLLKICNGPQSRSDNLLKGINFGYLLQFIASRGVNYRGQRKLMKRLCFIAFLTRKSAKQLFSVVDEPTPSDAWITALVVDCLVQTKQKIIGSKDCKKPLERKKCLDHLMDSLLPVLTSEKPTSSLLYTFSVVFNYILRYLFCLRDQFQLLIPLLQDYISIALSDYTEGERLIEGVIENRNELGELFPTTLVVSTFEQMLIHIVPPPESSSHILHGAATIGDFKQIIYILLLHTEGNGLEEDEDKCRRLLTLWSHICSCQLSSEKAREREEGMVRLLQQSMTFPELWNQNKALHLVRPIMDIISTISVNTSITLKNVMIDSCFWLISSVPLPPEDPQLVLSHLNSLLDTLFSLYLLRTTLLNDRLPVFLQRYRKCLFSLAQVCPASSSFIFINNATSIADKMERAATAMAKRAKDFSRIAPYIIADIMRIFQIYNLPSDLKFAYTRIINIFLSICDHHAVSFLKGILPNTQQELFNNVYENFKKHHRFIGKV